MRRRMSRIWCRRLEERVWRGAAVETVNETVVGDGRRMERWGSIIEYSDGKFSLCFPFASDYLGIYLYIYIEAMRTLEFIRHALQR